MNKHSHMYIIFHKHFHTFTFLTGIFNILLRESCSVVFCSLNIFMHNILHYTTRNTVSIINSVFSFKFTRYFKVLRIGTPRFLNLVFKILNTGHNLTVLWTLLKSLEPLNRAKLGYGKWLWDKDGPRSASECR